ncbi:formimidoylglutamate deiminase [Polaromonas sp. JS666]|uniref:formimidoylglutamate deiminase n=1 Tax=Polaromonas sp. (strain JS666 / ATCC BAA-500) TaxID=296591 RepID=UPI000885A7ED|nr:formimidoylglutamate deiminase [Polaromonas sp. JS666]SDN08958.1 formimidoylglutamate deiminase [Polaromonas sp. JS666]
MNSGIKTFFTPQAWVQGAWAKDVLLTVAANGSWHSVQPGATAQQQAGAVQLPGPVLPGLVNAHSHAFQRAMAGLTERRSAGAHASDDFWSWRDRMYSAANRITPEQLEAIAGQLYAELLAGGYTEVCDFHYLHNDVSGAAYADPAEMSLALVRAAQRTGIGLTLLPTLYMRSGFKAAGLREDQRRFSSTPGSVMRVVEQVRRQTQGDARIHVGVAVHSLRAAEPAALKELTAAAKQAGLPVHIHIAEQTQEVEDCIAHTGQRPIEWLLNNAEVDARWNLVHATHATAAELQGVQGKGAAIVICPATEANLGDGVFDLPAYAAAGGKWSIGSDSHVTRSWPEELRLLEYSQRLTLRQRNIAARVLGHESSAAGLFEAALAGGLPATGQMQAGLAPGQRADFVTLDLEFPALLGVPAGHLLDALVFSSPGAAFGEVFVAGQRIAAPSPEGAQAFARAMRELWAG